MKHSRQPLTGTFLWFGIPAISPASLLCQGRCTNSYLCEAVAWKLQRATEARKRKNVNVHSNALRGSNTCLVAEPAKGVVRETRLSQAQRRATRKLQRLNTAHVASPVTDRADWFDGRQYTSNR
jgi:hypothetical protein